MLTHPGNPHFRPHVFLPSESTPSPPPPPQPPQLGSPHPGPCPKPGKAGLSPSLQGSPHLSSRPLKTGGLEMGLFPPRPLLQLPVRAPSLVPLS